MGLGLRLDMLECKALGAAEIPTLLLKLASATSFISMQLRSHCTPVYVHASFSLWSAGCTASPAATLQQCWITPLRCSRHAREHVC